MLRYLLVVLGGAAGAATRYALGGWLADRWGAAFPWSTLVINLSGSLLLGFIGTLAVERLLVPPESVTLLGVGFIGAYTTFSTWQYETFRLLENGSWPLALVNLFVSSVLGLASVALGVVLGRLL
ncbi:MAG: fluoride efflux transporter CrcB [Limnochordaceae bacterium]|nr:fluoride efflux transporter CrcB [Limnochordaceae bacterium]